MAPTVAYLLGIQGPLNARGKILLNIIKGGEKLRELTVLNISDYHAQLIPLAEAADTVTGTGAVNPTFPIGGAAFLKPWLDAYRAEAPGGSLSVAGGDSFGGATPPISNFFEDRPGVDAMNLMGFDVEALGNHTFDRGEAFLRSVLIPRFNGQMLSANVVYPDDTTPPEWAKSKVFTLNGVKLGIVGFTTEATPSLLFPGKLGPFVVRPVVPASTPSSDSSEARRSDAILAIGHEGATAGTITNPTGPVVDIADAARRCRRGDGRPQRPAGDLAAGQLRAADREPGKGLRFTRVRMLVRHERQARPVRDRRLPQAVERSASRPTRRSRR